MSCGAGNEYFEVSPAQRPLADAEQAQVESDRGIVAARQLYGARSPAAFATVGGLNVTLDVVMPLKITGGSESLTIDSGWTSVSRVALVVPKKDTDLTVTGGVLAARPADVEKPWIAYASFSSPLTMTWKKRVEDARPTQAPSVSSLRTPVRSRTRCDWPVPEEVPYPVERSGVPTVAIGTIAPFARAGSPARKLIVETLGYVPPEGHRAKKPSCVGETTVTLMETALAVPGTPQTPFIENLRSVEAGTMPPNPVRVSTARHGVIAKY